MKDRTLHWLGLGLGIGVLGGWAARLSLRPHAEAAVATGPTPQRARASSGQASNAPAAWAAAKSSSELTAEALFAKIDPLRLTVAKRDLLNALENADSATLRRLTEELSGVADKDRSPSAETRRFLRDVILNRWLKLDPEAVLAYAIGRDPPPEGSVLGRTLGYWAQHDYSRLRKLREDSSGPVREVIDSAIMGKCPARTFADAWHSVGDLVTESFASIKTAPASQSPRRTTALWMFLTKMASSDWPGMKVWLASPEGARFAEEPMLTGTLAGIRNSREIQNWLAARDTNPAKVRSIIRPESIPPLDPPPLTPPHHEPLKTADEFQQWLVEQPQERHGNLTESWLDAWTTENPRVAADWIRLHRSEDWRGSRSIEVAGALAQQDGAAAVDFAHLFDEPQRWQVLQTALMQWARRDFAAASRIAEAEPAGRSRDNALKGLAEIVTEYPMEQALPWAAKLPADVRETASRKIFTELAAQEPTAAAAGLSDWLTAGYAVAPEAAEAVTKEWAAGEPDKAAAWTETLPAGPAQRAALRQAMKTWLGIDPPAATQWAAQLADPKLHKLAQEVIDHP